jgi:colicin import membrane protein
MTARRIQRRPGSRKAVVYAVLVHAALIALIVIGFRWQSKPATPAPVIQAQAVNDAEMQKEVERRQREERERAAQAAKKKRDAEALERKAADDKRRQEQAKLAEQKRADEARRKAAEAAEKKRQDAQRQAEAEKKRKDEQRQAEARRKKETEERRKAAETGLKDQLAREEKERADAQAKAEQLARAQSELARFEGLIRQKVERNWVRPAGWTKGMECVVRVRLIPTGEVVQATVARSSGNPAFDRSVENAVYKASPLPLPEDKGLFEHFRELELRFRPEGQA